MRTGLLATVLLPLLLAAEPAAPGEENGTGAGQALTKAMLRVQDEIGRHTQELIDLRKTIDAKRAPLVKRVEDLQRQNAATRRELDARTRSARHAKTENAQLAADIRALREQCRFIHAALSEYRRAMQTRASPPEAEMLAETLREIDPLLEQDDRFAALPEAAAELLETAGDWNQSRFGGRTIEGAALDSQGFEHHGRFAFLGPLGYFAADGGGPAGIAVTRFGSVRPAVYGRFDESVAEAIRGLVKGRQATVPVDLTAGDALKVKETKTGFVDHVRKGGLIMIPLLAIAGLALVLALWKCAALARMQVRAPSVTSAVFEHLKAGRVEQAREAAGSARQPLAFVLGEGIRHRSAPRAQLEEILHEHILSVAPRLERHLGALAVFGGVAPLLGLLGTVTGMIHTFRLVTIFGSGDAKLLSGGISEALVTTEFGLTIAIPVLLIHAYFARRVRSMISSLEQVALTFANQLNESSEADA